MIKKIFTLCFCLLSFSCFAITANASCGQSVPLGHPAFCESFRSVAYCQCMEMGGLGSDACSNMTILAQAMRDTFGSIEGGCAFQEDNLPPSDKTDAGTCTAKWNFYNTYC